MIGTNNLKSDGSEILLDKYEVLIREAEVHEFRKISLVSILNRTDIGEFHNSRRIGVNLRLVEMCKSKKIEFLEMSIDVRRHLSKDGLHLSWPGQDWVARRIFQHCKQHLN